MATENVECLASAVWNQLSWTGEDIDASPGEMLVALMDVMRDIAKYNDVPFDEIARMMVGMWNRRQEEESGLNVEDAPNGI